MRLIFIFSMFTIILSCKTQDSFGLKKMNKNERFSFISTNVKSNAGVNLGNFIFHLQQSNVELNAFEQLFLEKLRGSQYPYDINILTNLLIINKENIPEIEQILSSKIEIWDTGNWSDNFWNLIEEHNLNVEKPNYYNKESTSLKKYNISAFIKTKIENDELGKEPLLMVNWNIIDYETGKLIETLNKLDIKQIDYTPKSESVGLYGKGGVDGFLKIMTY